MVENGTFLPNSFCPVCLRAFTPSGPALACDSCGSFQRHRVMMLMFLAQIENASAKGAVLDFSPLRQMAEAARLAAGDRYLSLNIDKGSRVSVVADLSLLPLANGAAEVIHCSHILEHVPDDRSAMRELRRVLNPDGEVLIQVPRQKGVPTEEAVGAPSDELERRFGQADHVRLYGDDFENRLKAAGFGVHTTSYQQLLPPTALKLIGIRANHELWIAGTDPDQSPAIETDTLLRILYERIVSGLLAHETAMQESRDRVEAAAKEADEWRNHYEWLASQPVVRVGRRAKRLIPRLTRRRTEQS